MRKGCIAGLLCLLVASPVIGKPPKDDGASGGQRAKDSSGEGQATSRPADEDGAESKAPKKKGKLKAKRPPRNLAVKALRKRIPDATFEDTTFEDFCEWLSRTTEANVVVRWKLLEDEGIERDCPIELSRKNLTIREILPLVFAQATEDLPEVELAARADGNTLMITTRQDIQTKNVVRVYDVQDLLVAVPNFAGGTIDVFAGGRGIRQSATREGSDEQPREKLDPVVAKLIKAITTHVQPLSWKVNGGKGTIRFFKGRLVINNNVEVHQELAGMLSAKPREP